MSTALHRQKPENDKQNVNFAPPRKNFCGRPCVWDQNFFLLWSSFSKSKKYIKTM